MDLKTVKLLIGMKETNTQHDSFIDAKIPVLVSQAKDYCNNDFLVGDKEVLPAGVQQYVADAIKYDILGRSNLKSRTMGNVSYSFNTNYPSDVTQHLTPYKKLRW